MKYLIALIFAFLSTTVFAAQGYVVYAKSSCDYYIVESDGGFALLEWYGGSMPEVGDFIIGDFESYGFKDIYNKTSDREMRIYVEDYWLSKNRVIEKYKRKCRIN